VWPLAVRGSVSRLFLHLNSLLLMSKTGPYDRVSAKQPDKDENVDARSRT
jgi:hypothetical protein